MDVKEKAMPYDKRYVNLLLQDKSTGTNIRWATDNYESLGPEYAPGQQVMPSLIGVIRPRVYKDEQQQMARTRDNAEVFTPSWVANAQNNLADGAWFGREGVFNTESGTGWTTNREKVTFPGGKGKAWRDYIDERHIEMCCGEAPYLISRYDTVTGQTIPVEDRIGTLDRKLRIVNENAADEQQWCEWALRAYQATYGFELQGDSLFLARYGLLATYIDNMVHRFGKEPEMKQVRHIANVISWNIWQMDGFTFTAPHSEQEILYRQLSLFDTAEEKGPPVPCRVFDWRSKKSMEFRSLLGQGKEGK